MQDNARPHCAKYTQNRLRELGIWGYFIDWPPSSPDCNPIENVWRLMKQRIRKRNPFPATMESLKIAIQEKRDFITPEELPSLVNSIPTRVREVGLSTGASLFYLAESVCPVKSDFTNSPRAS